jgi:signal transduction histidine kinase
LVEIKAMAILESRKILIIDDDSAHREFSRRYLKKDQTHVYEFTEAESIQQGIDFCRKATPDCILLDYNLPGGNGLDFLKEIKQHFVGKHPPVIMLTSEGSEDIAVRSMKQGASDYLVKDGLSSDSILRAVNNVTEKHTYKKYIEEQQAQLFRKSAEVRQKNKELESANQQLSDFSHTVAHDLKQPLSVTIGMLELIRDHDDARIDSKDIMERSLNSLGRMNDLIESLLAWSKGNKYEIKNETIDMTSVLDDVLIDLKDKIDGSRAKIDIGELPNLLGSRTQLYQIFLNLISNAIKFNPADVSPHIEIYAQSEEVGPEDSSGSPKESQLIRLVVEDHGIGIEENNLQHIFEPFKRLHCDREYQGTGIGLATVKKMVENHSGSIVAESEFGKGTRFILTLPVEP